jgi:TolB-like protein
LKTAKLLIVLCSLLIVSCATTPKGPDELDIAIRDASDYLNNNVPNGNKIVVLNVKSDYANLSDYVIDELIANAVNDRNFSVVDRAQLETIRMELNFQYSGEVDDDSALSIGKFLGAQTIVSGSMSALGNRHRMTIRALNVETAQVQGQYNRNINSSRTIIELMKGGRPQRTTYGASTAGATSSGTTPSGGTAAAQQVKPKTGTYTFFPRPQATFNGMPKNDYLSKIVVSGNYVVVYISRTPRGPSSGGPDGWNAWRLNGLLTDLDNPSRAWKVSAADLNQANTDGLVISFENVTGTRFSLEGQWDGTFIFSEIKLNEPD